MSRSDSVVRLAEMIKASALEVRQPGELPFLLSGGGTSRYYLDIRKLSLSSNGLRAIVEAMLDEAFTNAGDLSVNAIGGPCVGADPIVGGLLYCIPAGIPMRGFLVRDKAKTHGKMGRIIGSLVPGDRCMIVEDVVTTGSTVIDCIDCLEAAGMKPLLVISVVDRLEGAADRIEERGVAYYPLLTVADLGLV